MLKHLNHKKYFSNGNKLKKNLSLPIDENLNLKEIKYIVKKLNQFSKNFYD